MNQPFTLYDEDGYASPVALGMDTSMSYKTPSSYQHGPLRREMRLVRATDHPTLSTTLAIYRDERRVFLFPLTLGLSEQITVSLGTADSDFIEAVYRHTKSVVKSYYVVSGLSRDAKLPEDSPGIMFVGICQSIDYDCLGFEAPAGFRNWGGRYYFVKTTTKSENSELARLLETLNPPGGCVMATDVLYGLPTERPDEKLVQAILKEPHRYFMNDFGSPLDKRFKHAIMHTNDSVDYIDRNPQRVVLSFGFRINYNLTNRLMPPALRKERFVLVAYREALRRKPDLFSCFGMPEVDLVETKDLDMFLSHLEPMQILVNGTRFHTPSGYVENYQLGEADKNPDLTIDMIRDALGGVITRNIRTCGLVFNGLRQLFVPEVNDTNHFALKHQIPADREPLAFTDGLYMRVNAK